MEHASAQHRAAAADASAAALNITKVAGARITYAFVRSSRSVRTTLAGCAADAKDGLRRWGGERAHKGWGEPSNADARHAPLERGRLERAGEAAAGAAGRPERSADVMCTPALACLPQREAASCGSTHPAPALEWKGRSLRRTVSQTVQCTFRTSVCQLVSVLMWNSCIRSRNSRFAF